MPQRARSEIPLACVFKRALPLKLRQLIPRGRMKLTWNQGEVFWTVFQLTCFFLLLGLYLMVFRDIFRSHDMGGVAKMIWVVFVIFLPLLGVLLYLIARGGKMTQHNIDVAVAEAAAVKQHHRSTGGSGTIDELERLEGLKSRGVLTEAEFESQKALLLA